MNKMNFALISSPSSISAKLAVEAKECIGNWKNDLREQREEDERERDKRWIVHTFRRDKCDCFLLLASYKTIRDCNGVWSIQWNTIFMMYWVILVHELKWRTDPRLSDSFRCRWSHLLTCWEREEGMGCNGSGKFQSLKPVTENWFREQLRECIECERSFYVYSILRTSFKYFLQVRRCTSLYDQNLFPQPSLR